VQGIRDSRGRAGPGTGSSRHDGTSPGDFAWNTRERTARVLWTGEGRHSPGLWTGIWRRTPQALLLVREGFRVIPDHTGTHHIRGVYAMTEHSGDRRGLGLEHPSSSSSTCAQGANPQVTSVPLRTALRIARERQRSKSSRRKIFREEPERYLDIVHLMKDPGSE